MRIFLYIVQIPYSEIPLSSGNNHAIFNPAVIAFIHHNATSRLKIFVHYFKLFELVKRSVIDGESRKKMPPVKAAFRITIVVI